MRDAIVFGMSCPALSLIGVSKRFRAGVPGCSASVDALRAVDVGVDAGEILGIVGPAGAGKSTLLLCAAGLLRADFGTVRWFGGEPMPAVSSSAVAFVAEHPVGHPCLGVRDRMVREVCDVEVCDVYGELSRLAHEQADRTSASLVQAAAGGCPREPLAQLPLPRRRLLAVARAIAARPRLLLLDETLDAVDGATSAAMCAALRALASAGTAVVVTSECERPIATIVTRCLVLIRGVVHADQRRNRSAARVRGSSRSARALSSMRSTNGRSFRSPQ